MSDDRQGLRMSRITDIGQIATLLTLFAVGVGGIGSVYYSVISRMDDLHSEMLKQSGKAELIQQRVEQGERVAADKRDSDKAFSAEMRASLILLTQSIADLKTIMAGQDARRR